MLDVTSQTRRDRRTGVKDVVAVKISQEVMNEMDECDRMEQPRNGEASQGRERSFSKDGRLRLGSKCCPQLN